MGKPGKRVGRCGGAGENPLGALWAFSPAPLHPGCIRNADPYSTANCFRKKPTIRGPKSPCLELMRKVWGAPSILTYKYLAPRSSHNPANFSLHSIGTVLSAVPCRMKIGTWSFSTYVTGDAISASSVVLGDSPSNPGAAR